MMNSVTWKMRSCTFTSSSALPPVPPVRTGGVCRSTTILPVKWQGLGPSKAYPDKRSASRIGVWSIDPVAELQTPYEGPQENGNRIATS